MTQTDDYKKVTEKFKNFDELQERCKYWQNIENHILPKTEWIIIHCDGRSFSKLIKNKFKRPFDNVFTDLMDKTAAYVSSKISGCVFSYVQSDEISFIIHNRPDSEPFFNNRLCKIQSIVASMCTGMFMKLLYDNEIKGIDLIQFDCKAWSVCNYEDVLYWLAYRQKDCVRNSKLQTAQTWLSHKELMHKSAQESVEYLLEKKNISWWDEISPGHKIGRMIYKKKRLITNDYGTFERNVWEAEPATYFDDVDKIEQFGLRDILNS